MTNDEIESLLEAVATTRQGAKAAVARLVAAGHAPDEAAELVLSALGGGDLIEIGEDGRERYVASGRLVREVLTEMER